MSKKPKDTGEQDDDYDADLAAQAELQKKYEAEALATPKAEGKAAETYETVEEVMPQRFFTGGATAAEKEAWIEAHGGVDPTQPTGEVAPGDAEPEGDVPPQ